MRKIRRYLNKYKNRLEYLEERDKNVRHRDATIGICLILMAVGWNKIASVCNKLPIISFTYNEGWGFFQMSILLIGCAFMICSVWKIDLK